MNLERLSQDELAELARDIAMDRVYCVNSEEAVRLSFGALIGLMDPPMTMDFADQIGAVYESMAKALPRSINGYPMFLSCRFLHRDDLPRLFELVDEKRRILETL